MRNSDFPVLNHSLYFNHAAVAPWPKPTAQAVQAFAEENAQQGTLNYPHWLTTEQELRVFTQQLINAPHTDDIALVKNTSEGLSFIASGLKWQAGDNIVGIQQEFPSNRFPWLSLANQGVEFRPLDLNQYNENPEQALINLCDQHTRLIAISAVQYSNGLRMDLEMLGNFCRQHNILFCVDAIQQLGAIPFDVQKIQADFVVADGHKWMLGPEGLGIFYIRRELLEELTLTQFGWHMAENIGDYTASSFTPARTARRFECGSPNMLGIHALHASLTLLLDEGMEKVWQRLNANMQYLSQGLQSIPHIEILSDLNEHRRSGILTFRSSKLSNEVLFSQLQTQGIFCAPRGGGIRLSPHFYTPQVHLDKVISLVADL